MRIARILAVFIIVVCFRVGAFAQDYPTKPVKIIVPFTKGSAVDVVGRALSQKLSEIWGQPVGIENVPGAGGTVGADRVAKSPPDGYTLLYHSSAYALSPALYAKLAYDPLKDFAEVCPVTSQPYLLVVGASAGIKSVSELILAAKAKPGQLKFASAGTGSGAHFCAEQFRLAAGIDVGHVPYPGGPEAIADTIAGKVTYYFSPLAIALKGVQEGKLLALGVTSAKRARQLPEVPTVAEAKVVGDFESTTWGGVWVPAGVSAGVKDKLAKDIARALAFPDLRDQLTKLGADPMTMTSEEFARFVRGEMEAAARAAKAAGIQPQ